MQCCASLFCKVFISAASVATCEMDAHLCDVCEYFTVSAGSEALHAKAHPRQKALRDIAAELSCCTTCRQL